MGGLTNLESSIQASTSEKQNARDGFLKVMSPFVDEATEVVSRLVENAKVMKGRTESLAGYFAEEPESFDPESVFNVLHKFGESFDKARKDNQKIKEALLQQQRRGQPQQQQ